MILATPLVAGVLANFLSYDPVPFNTDDGKVAANAKKYLQEVASWERQKGVKVIWNGVTEKENPKKGKDGDDGGGKGGGQDPPLDDARCQYHREKGIDAAKAFGAKIPEWVLPYPY